MGILFGHDGRGNKVLVAKHVSIPSLMGILFGLTVGFRLGKSPFGLNTLTDGHPLRTTKSVALNLLQEVGLNTLTDGHPLRTKEAQLVAKAAEVSQYPH